MLVPNKTRWVYARAGFMHAQRQDWVLRRKETQCARCGAPVTITGRLYLLSTWRTNLAAACSIRARCDWVKGMFSTLYPLVHRW